MAEEDKALGKSIEEFMQGLDNYVELEPDAVNSETQLILNWGRKGFGFGMLSFFDRDGVIECDNECMSRESCRAFLQAFIDGTPSTEQLPPMLLRYGSAEALLDASTPSHPGPDWLGPMDDIEKEPPQDRD